MSQKQVFTVIGIDPSQGTFTDQKTGRNVNYDSTNFNVLVPVKNGHGMKAAVQKMPGAGNYQRFKDIQLPCEMEFEFNLEFSGQFPKTTLINVTKTVVNKDLGPKIA
ncbi:hypothetical protein HCY58_13740 [Acinetobacter radioresistens]|uniref:hypothetical protein n=2 Tax=Acinetobacter TaxID=469 RepID=UPI0020054C4C|nr:hypothetical protein [Acinetobacter radioresistens]MCK4088104.1 hypothetical protein [Acinetobacter radioresistens]MCX0338260.1 hypothetical protein [Acinetobacter radioresistens]